MCVNRQKVAVHRRHVARYVRHGPYRADPLAQPNAQGAIGRQAEERCSPSAHFIMRYQETVALVPDQLLDSSQIRTDHWRSSCKGFERDDWPRLQPLRGNRERIETGEKGANL